MCAVVAKSAVPFPLTPALSLGEREKHHASLEQRQCFYIDRRFEFRPLLPKGEGWDEGERDVQCQSAITNWKGYNNKAAFALPSGLHGARV